MGGVTPAGETAGDESEDLEGESSGSEDLEEEDLEDEEELEEAGDGMDVDEPAKPNGASGSAAAGKPADSVLAH